MPSVALSPKTATGLPTRRTWQPSSGSDCTMLPSLFADIRTRSNGLSFRLETCGLAETDHSGALAPVIRQEIFGTYKQLVDCRSRVVAPASIMGHDRPHLIEVHNVEPRVRSTSELNCRDGKSCDKQFKVRVNDDI